MSGPTESGLICAECVHDPAISGTVDTAVYWCSCLDGQQCRGPCRQRSHTPDRCPFRTAWVPMPRDARFVIEGDVVQLLPVGDAITGELMIVTASGGHPDVNGEPAWRIDLVGLAVPGGMTKQTVMPPDYPVPVLVPYAERALALQLNARVMDRS
jgi:hypothetical protein